MQLPEFTYTVIKQWDDGDIVSSELHVNGANGLSARDHAFDEAADHLTKFGGDVIVERTERDDMGRCLTIRNITEQFFDERFPNGVAA